MLSELEAGLGYTFRDKSILENALTHSSYANENRERGLRDNERLEFLGDSILGFVVADYLYRSFPDRPEGELTRIRADLVCEKNLARAAGTISLGSFLLLGHGEEHGGGRKRDSIVHGVRDRGQLHGRRLLCRKGDHRPPDPLRRSGRQAA
jgi:ribonuclease-3